MKTLGAVFFASGAASLIFENLWFREAGLAIGNSIRATSLVLAAFMAGLAFGGWLVARFGHRVARLVRMYAALELVVALTGLAAIAIVPSCSSALAVFALLLVPTTAMGATLPILVAALSRRQPSFGSVLGRLYGWNTLGAVVGVLGCELALVPWLGIRGTAYVAALVGGGVAIIALAVSRRFDGQPTTEPRVPLTWRGARVLACAFACGAALLALEVIWFRILALFVLGTSLALALMLAVILAGLALGGLVASRWLREQHVAIVAILAGVATVASYLTFRVGGTPGSGHWQDAILDTVRLALPTSILSGALFAMLGSLAKRELGSTTRAAGMLVLWNTLGAMLGALAGGFVMLSNVGVDGSLFLVCIAYGGVAVCAPLTRSLREYIAFAVLAASLALFPFGAMRDHVDELLSNVTSDDARVVAYREGATATISVIEHRWEDRPVSYQLVTDGYSMSSTAYTSRRYMKLFVYMPIALRADPKRALLICYGVGQTAKALTDTASLEHIDVVDISRDILELGRVEFPQGFPLDDPRVETHVEDGRFFLRSTSERYDIITGEPPPPQIAGVVNLYSREYFDLVRSRLVDGGIATYWLPIHQLSDADARSIIHAYCDAFPDCSLWTGFGFEWMLMGTRGFSGGTSEAQFAKQWSDPRVAPELRAIGVEQPEQLGALFMADAPTLRAWSDATPPLDDDHPARLQPGDRDGTLAIWMDTTAARDRFAHSQLVAHLWPAALRERTLPYFAIQRSIDALSGLKQFEATSPIELAIRLGAIREIQRTTDLRTLVMLMFGYTAAHERILDELPATEALLARGIRALADHHFDEAAAHFAAIAPQTENLRLLRDYAMSSK